MKSSRIRVEYLVLGIVIVALLLYLFLRNPDRVQYEIPEIDTLSVDQIQKIELVHSGETIILEMVDNQWLIQPQGYLADPEKVKNITGTIAGLRLTDVISESRNYAKYGLDPGNKIVARIFEKGRLLRAFEIGKQAATYRHTFVRIRDDDRVFHAQESFRANFEQTVGSLRNKLVLKFDKNEIMEMELIKENQKMVFKKNSEKMEIKPGEMSQTAGIQVSEKSQTKEKEIWVMPDGKKGKVEEINNLISELSDLQCQEFIQDKTSSDFTDPIYQIQLNGLKNYTLQIYKKNQVKDDSYPAISSETPYPFLLSTYKAEQFMKKAEDIIVSLPAK